MNVLNDKLNIPCDDEEIENAELEGNCGADDVNEFDEDEVYVRNVNGELVKLEVTEDDE